MAKRLVLLDFRLTGTVSSDVGKVIQVSVRTPIKEVFDKAAAHAKSVGGLDDLLICCHGFHADGAVAGADISIRTEGGQGLELGTENLDFTTVGNVAVLNGSPPLAKRIVIFSCGAAATHPQLKNQHGDGMRLMGEIALTTGARVVASNESQLFHNFETLTHFLFGAGSKNDGRIDFGEWEGDVFEFSPDDGAARKLKRAEHPRFDF